MPFDIDSVRSRLLGRRIEWFSSVGSTMIEASRLAREGCTAGTLVGADRQTAGVGRHGRAWHSEPGAGLYVSFVLRPAMDASRLPLLMLAMGLAAREAIVKTTGLSTDLRWPNDVLINGKKCAGMLAQMENGGAVIAGIGINVSHTAFGPGLADIATSLRLEGAGVSREDLLVTLAPSVDEFMALVSTKPSVVLDLFTHASSYVLDRRVSVEQDGGPFSGVTCGLDASGFLRLRQDSGLEVTILAGGVRPV